MAMAYEDLIAACEARGAKMYFEKEGHQWGAWVIRLPHGKTIIAESNGSGFPLLDQCYTPDPTLRVHNHYTHYMKPLIPEAVEKLLSGKSLPRKARRSRQSY
jgi:hypothetical protein